MVVGRFLLADSVIFMCLKRALFRSNSSRSTVSVDLIELVICLLYLSDISAQSLPLLAEGRLNGVDLWERFVSLSFSVFRNLWGAVASVFLLSSSLSDSDCLMDGSSWELCYLFYLLTTVLSLAHYFIAALEVVSDTGSLFVTSLNRKGLKRQKRRLPRRFSKSRQNKRDKDKESRAKTKKISARQSQPDQPKQSPQSLIQRAYICAKLCEEICRDSAQWAMEPRRFKLFKTLSDRVRSE
ncbi:hypothetical protein Tco_0962530 [Tanacetum coccineum]